MVQKCQFITYMVHKCCFVKLSPPHLGGQPRGIAHLAGELVDAGAAPRAGECIAPSESSGQAPGA